MALMQFLITALLGLQVLAASPPTKKPADPTVPHCFNDQEVQKTECPAALAKIIYDKDTLNKLETELSVVSGECLKLSTVLTRNRSSYQIRVYNKKQAVVTKKQIEETVTGIVKSCKSGHAKIKGNTEVAIWVTRRLQRRNWYTPYDPDFPLEKTYCFHRDGVVKEDCLEAFNQLPVDKQGQLVSPATKKLAHSLDLKFKSCRVTAYTTDGTNVLVKKQDVSAIVTGMINHCNLEWGTVNIKGAEGPNGHVTITSRSY
ncbi:uncharacterized protein PGTG_19287 [Puccinia graminis f. sp. tritici CRL 75-36-700-3]|uniref:Uncharacterized protein n=1 Tax=Puccinia graminis f. sp. tritici (strain CRL 75-36-700-3 / race SCCL) TaxID=418459 RepID=E3L9V7_PUCGT|nr:uncharacterized protein PGTG_19287 [Puccinia graminis f. sp. tritici CRL 75-36-700-3]EFP93332.2 hypothetical protein PGTG_19287 [Puccinia graminis f. sp. tritici CRL 75-36-700-3]